MKAQKTGNRSRHKCEASKENGEAGGLRATCRPVAGSIRIVNSFMGGSLPFSSQGDRLEVTNTFSSE